MRGAKASACLSVQRVFLLRKVAGLCVSRSGISNPDRLLSYKQSRIFILKTEFIEAYEQTFFVFYFANFLAYSRTSRLQAMHVSRARNTANYTDSARKHTDMYIDIILHISLHISAHYVLCFYILCEEQIWQIICRKKRPLHACRRRLG